ncbi:MAG: Glyceraldehyde-3-phosphate dehydrogenase, type I [Microgenomates group bacterium GW2011_GWA2_47_8]|nr:MAG: Glyceraldehyde-3-phosphate dehydrogenase, type I [Microgenomates group bacterium GW2011_GWA2_47_8]
MTIGINGFGRIGRNAARVILESSDLSLGAINSMSSADSHAYLLAHDSTQGAFDEKIKVHGSSFTVHGKTIDCFGAKEPSEISWEKAGVDVVLECTGKFRTTQEASKHLGSTVKRVVISAPVKDDTPTYIMGVNHQSYTNQPVISSSSCTTNCVTTVLKVLHDNFSVLRGSMTTVHAVTDSQNLLDNSHKKEVRLRRSALVNMIPTTSGSARDVAKMFPHLVGLLPCRSIRVPLPAVSLIDLTVEVKKKTTVSEINNAFENVAKTSMNGILAVAGEEFVSTDFVGDSHSSIVDPFLTDVVDGTLVHITAWYDNEWGYANRLVDLARLIAK